MVLVLGVVLCLAQLLASYGMVAAARAAVVPTYSMTEAWADRSVRRGLDFTERVWNKPDQENVRNVVKNIRHRADAARVQFGTVTSAIQRTLDSWWFLLALHLTMFLALLYSLWKMPGQQSFVLQSAGYVCIFLPVTLLTLWLGSLGNHILLVFFLMLCVPVVRFLGWLVALLAHGLTLALFTASTFGWTEQKLRSRPVVATMWENGNLKSWGGVIKKNLFRVAVTPLILIAVAALTEVDWPRVGERLSRTYNQIPPLPPALKVMVKVTVVGLACVVCLAVVTRLMPWLRQKDWRRSLHSRSEDVRSWGQKLGESDGCAGCLGWITLGLIVSGLSSIAWQSLWDYTLTTFGLFPSFPLAANVALSAIIYAEAAGCVVALAVGLIKGRSGWKPVLKGLGIWTLVCMAATDIVLLVWKLSRINWRAVGDSIGAHVGGFFAYTLNLFGFLPSLVNGLLSLAVYVEIIGCLAGLAVGLRKKDVAWGQARKVMKVTTKISLVMALIAFLLWGLGSLLGFLGSSLQEVVISGRLAQLIAVIIVVVLGVWFIVHFVPQVSEVMPYLGARHKPAESDETWKRQFRGLDPNTQAGLLKRVTRGMFNLSDQKLLLLLEEIEPSIEKEPALSAYWEKRFEIEQITRQHRIG